MMTATPKERFSYVTIVDANQPPETQLTVRLFHTPQAARAFLTSILASYGVPYEVWRALHGVLGEDALPFMRQGVCLSIGETLVE